MTENRLLFSSMNFTRFICRYGRKLFAGPWDARAVYTPARAVYFQGSTPLLNIDGLAIIKERRIGTASRQSKDPESQFGRRLSIT